MTEKERNDVSHSLELFYVCVRACVLCAVLCLWELPSVAAGSGFSGDHGQRSGIACVFHHCVCPILWNEADLNIRLCVSVCISLSVCVRWGWEGSCEVLGALPLLLRHDILSVFALKGTQSFLSSFNY